MHRITTRDRVSAPREQVISWLAEYYPTIDWSTVSDHLPPIIWRHRWNEYADRYGLPLRRGTIQNRDSAGTGPFSPAPKK